jgi:hypothetical protein
MDATVMASISPGFSGVLSLSSLSSSFVRELGPSVHPSFSYSFSNRRTDRLENEKENEYDFLGGAPGGRKRKIKRKEKESSGLLRGRLRLHRLDDLGECVPQRVQAGAVGGAGGV